MKTINNLWVEVTYKVGLGDVQVSDEVYDALVNSEAITLEDDNPYLSKEENVALDWLVNNIKEDDCCEIKFEVLSVD